jgi:predicted N-acetyltransferase YhbS
MKIRIDHLFNHPDHLQLVAGWIYNEFWTGKPGHSVETLEARLSLAGNPDCVPLSLLALADGQPAGTVNLVENDNEQRPQLRPWLAALLVVPGFRKHGIGSALTRAIVEEAKRLGFSELFLGTDMPDFYIRLGAELHEQPSESYCIMRFSTDKT